MKRKCIAAFAAATVLFTVCSVSAIPNPIQEVSQQEAAEITGIKLIPFDEAEDVSFSVIDSKTSEMDFVYQNKHFFYRAEPTAETMAYDMSGLYYEWNEEGETEVGYCDAFFNACDEAAVLYWIDIVPGVNYTLGCTEHAEMDEMIDIANRCFYSLQDEEWNLENAYGSEDDEEWTSIESIPSDFIEFYTWKYDDKDGYFRNYGNKTYGFYDADLNSDGRIYFWEKAESEDQIQLLDEKGEILLTMTIADAYADQPTLTDSENQTLSPVETVLNGTYTCSMNALYLDGDMLTLTAELPFYVSNTEVENLKTGDVLNHSDYDFMGIEIESIEKKNDDLYLLNEMYELSYQPEADAWLLADETPIYEQIGTCQITADTQILDLDQQVIFDLTSVLEKYDFVTAQVTTENGQVDQITILSVE